MHKNVIKKNPNGFSLIEMVVTIAVSSVLLLTIAHFTQNMFFTFARIEKAKTLSETLLQARMALASNAQCTLNMKGLKLSTTVPAGVSVNALDIFDLKTSTRGSSLVSKGQKFGASTLQSIMLKPGKQIEVGLLTATLEMSFLTPSETNGPLVMRSFPLMVRTKAGLIDECWLRTDQVLSESDKVCSVMSSGALTYYDPVTKTCSLPSAKWFDGTSSQAKCPAGTLFPPNAVPLFNCQPKSAGPTAADPFPKTAIQYSDGSVVLAARPPVVFSIQNQTCYCDWAADLDPSVVSSMTCQVLCLVP